MAWTNLTFGSGSKLTSTKMLQLFNNFQALADGDSGAPQGSRIVHFWVQFQGSGTVSARDSQNVLSVTDNGPGSYTVNLVDAFANSNWAVMGMAGDLTGVGTRIIYLRSIASNLVLVYINNLSGAADAETVCVAGIGSQ